MQLNAIPHCARMTPLARCRERGLQDGETNATMYRGELFPYLKRNFGGARSKESQMQVVKNIHAHLIVVYFRIDESMDEQEENETRNYGRRNATVSRFT